MPQQWDIFCRVIDNYGDIGVAWRLAKTLCHDHQKQVRLWCDDIKVLHALKPSIDMKKESQFIDNIQVNLWQESSSFSPAADVVIEAFGCDLPESYLDLMQTQPPVWINLDYFSAEPWVSQFHAMSSKQANGLDKYFFYPSVLPNSGGLIREANLLQKKHDFLQHHQNHAPSAASAWLTAQGIQCQNNSFKISLFSYENPAIAALMDSWQQSEQPIEVFVPQGRIINSLNQLLDVQLSIGQPLKMHNLTLHLLPFLPQADYDKLLWCCDLNFVRGEESMARAQWAGKPFVWHIYPTEDRAHWDKLEAFFQIYSHALAPAAQTALVDFNRGWNQSEHQTLSQQAWLDLSQNIQPLSKHAKQWIEQLEILGDLTSNLVKFVQSKV